MNRLKIILLIVCWAVVNGAYAQTYTLSDPVFAKFLKDNYAATINTSGDLVISEAYKVRGTFSGGNKGFTNVDGIQFFTGISTLNLDRNKLKSIPDISPISDLINLNIATNNLVYLPSLSKLKRLKVLDLQENALVVFPDLNGADSLQRLILHYNNLDTIPDLSSLQMLKEIHIHYNKLKDVSNLQNLLALETIICYKNEITVTPNFSNLTKLRNLNIGYNQLTSSPIVGNNANLEIMYANDNNIVHIPDNYSGCSNIKNIRLYNNLLTFRELSKFITVQGYDTLVKLNPQPAFAIAKDTLIKEQAYLMLQTSIDQGVPNVFYEWYKNGQIYKTTQTDELSFQNVSLGDAGLYHCYIKHQSFTKYYIKTDTFNLKVSACNDLAKITFSVADIQCLKPGSIAFVDSNSGSHQNTYLLKSNVSENVFVGKNGQFTNLTDPSYTFSVITQNGCEKTYPSPLLVGQKDCEEVLLYPDAEGNNSYYFSEAGSVSIYDKRGNLIRKLSIPNAWHGEGDKGSKLPSGFYVADINNGQKIIGITILY